MTKEVYGTSDPDHVRLNAFKHATWNAIGVQELCQATLNKWTSLDRIRKLASAHEYVQSGSNWVLGNTLSDAMDLSNNLVGRTYMYNTIERNFLGVVKYIPSDARIRDDIKVFSFSKKNSVAEIFSLSSEYNWTNLGDFSNGYGYHPTTAGKLVYIAD